MIRALTFLLALFSGAAQAVVYIQTEEGGGGGCATYATDPAAGLLLHYQSLIGNVFQNNGCSTAVTADGDPVRCIVDIAGTLSNSNLTNGNDDHTWQETFLNGKDALSGDGDTAQPLTSGTTGASEVTDITLVIEMEGADATNSVYQIYDSTFNTDMILKVNNSAGDMAVAFDTVTGTKLTSGNYADGTDLLVIITWSFDDQTGTMRINGTDVATDVATGTAETFQPHLISAFSAEINMTESMIYDDILSGGEITALEACMGY